MSENPNKLWSGNLYYLKLEDGSSKQLPSYYHTNTRFPGGIRLFADPASTRLSSPASPLGSEPLRPTGPHARVGTCVCLFEKFLVFLADNVKFAPARTIRYGENLR